MTAATSGFLNLDDYPHAAALAADLCAHVPELRAEALECAGGRHFSAWPEDINAGGWEVLGVKWQGQMLANSVATTASAVVERHQCVVNAGYSLMKPGTEITPHVGYTSDVLRLHVGLIVPPAGAGPCELVVGGEARSWRDGEAFLFDDTVLHSAHNRTTFGRIIFLVDVLREV